MVITYPEAHYAQNLYAEILENTRGLPLYREDTKGQPPHKRGPAVDYTNANHAYALDATLLYDPLRDPKDVLSYGPSEAAQIMLVERASGHGVIGSFNGVTGYIDTLHNPSTNHDDTPFDPIAHTLQEELVTECGFT